jgi:hypothetical protein
MSCRTVPGTDQLYQYNRTVPGTPFSERSVDGRYIGFGIGLLGTTPTFTEITAIPAGLYTTPAGCVYIEVYAVGGGGGGASGDVSSTRRNGGGGGAGGVAVGFFPAGTYAYQTGNPGSGGAIGSAGFPGATTTFDILTGGGGDGGVKWSAGVTLAAAAGVATNSLFPLGCASATPPGLLGGNGGANYIKGYSGRGSVSNAVDIIGTTGATGGGGSGGCGTEAGASGGRGHILIIEYY